VRGIITLLWVNPLLFLKGQSAYLELNDDGSADAEPGIEAVPVGLEKMVYTKIGLALRKRCILYEFPYDWRRPIEYNAGVLAQTLEKWSGGNPRRRYTLVGHSMGGLVARAYLALYPQQAERRVKQVIMHGTPHFGAAGAVENMALGSRELKIVSLLNSNNVPMRLLLNLPGIYELLPAPPALFPAGRPYPADWDLYKATEWQVQGIRQDYLELGQRFHELLAGADPQTPLIQIAGCNQDTVVEVQHGETSSGAPEFRTVRSEEGRDAGDGTVPHWSAVLPGAQMYFVQEIHRYLPTNKRVIQATLDLVEGGAPDLPTELPPRKAGWFERDALAREETAASELRARLEEGAASERDLSQLYFVG
jgi:pimeloyl-ACP methyl ester carboxylesterase